MIEVQINPRIFGGHRESGVIQVVHDALATVAAIEVTKSERIPAQSILVDGRTAAFVDDLDAWDSLVMSENSADLLRWLAQFHPAIVFKIQCRRGADYPQGTVSAGYFCHPKTLAWLPCADVLHRERPIHVTGRMRTTDYRGPTQPWMEERLRIVEQAATLVREGYVAVHGKVAPAQYLNELMDAQIGFHWRGYGRLSYRLIEYMRAGVIPITQPLGSEWPIREDITLEDGVTCIFCDNPARFAMEAKALLRDCAKLHRMRSNICELWAASLTMRAMGQWYWQQLEKAHRAAADRPANGSREGALLR